MSATQKLVQLGVEREVAEKLVSQNLTTPAAIRKATQAELKDVTGLSTEKAKALKDKFDRKK